MAALVAALSNVFLLILVKASLRWSCFKKFNTTVLQRKTLNTTKQNYRLHFIKTVHHESYAPKMLNT